MNTVEEYFDHVRQLVENLSDAQAERYEEHILTATRGNLHSYSVALLRQRTLIHAAVNFATFFLRRLWSKENTLGRMVWK